VTVLARKVEASVIATIATATTNDLLQWAGIIPRGA